MELILAATAVAFVLGFSVGYSLSSRWHAPKAEEEMLMPLLGVVQPKEKRDTNA